MKNRLFRNVFLILAGFLFAILYVTTRVRTVEVGYEVSRAQERVRALQQDQGLLKSRIAKTKATSRLDRWTKRLQMQRPEEDKFFYEDKEK